MALPEFLSPAEARTNDKWARQIAAQIDANRPKEARFPYATAFMAERLGPAIAADYVQLWSRCGRRDAVEFVKKNMPKHMSYSEEPEHNAPRPMYGRNPDTEMEEIVNIRRKERHPPILDHVDKIKFERDMKSFEDFKSRQYR